MEQGVDTIYAYFLFNRILRKAEYREMLTNAVEDLVC